MSKTVWDLSNEDVGKVIVLPLLGTRFTGRLMEVRRARGDTVEMGFPDRRVIAYRSMPYEEETPNGV